MVISCQKGDSPKEISYKVEICDFCQMKIANPPFVSQGVNSYGKYFFFDSIECAIAYEIEKENLEKIWVADYLNPQKWLLLKGEGKEEKAYVLYSPSIRSPMGGGLVATSKESVEKLKTKFSGEILSYGELKKYIEEKWLPSLQGKRHSHH